MKNPNGYGTIKKLSGSRRRPYVFVTTANGKQKAIGYFSTYVDALIYQVDYNKQHDLHRLSKVTFAELYHRWLPQHIEYYQVSESTINGYKSSYKHCHALYDMPADEIRYSHLQAVIDNMKGLSYSSKKKVRNLLSLLFCYGRKMEYTRRDFTGLIHIGKNKAVNPHHPISKRKVNQLWSMVDTVDGVDIILILIYTGMRNIELRQLLKSDVNRRQKYLRIRKSKTAAGIRTIPIHSRIWPLVEKRLDGGTGEYLITNRNGHLYTYSALSRLFRKVMGGSSKYKLHDTRHTCATWLDGAEVNENARKMILGHARDGVTNSVYTHKTLRQLRKAIEKI